MSWSLALVKEAYQVLEDNLLTVAKAVDAEDWKTVAQEGPRTEGLFSDLWRACLEFSVPLGNKAIETGFREWLKS